MERNIAAANWKMNLTLGEALQFSRKIASEDLPDSVEVIIAPPFPYLYPMREILRETRIALAAQNIHWEEQGAFTGEVSAPILRSLGIVYVIIGHSERRQIFGEDNQMLKSKVSKACQDGMYPIFCCGEQLGERKSGKHLQVIEDQIEEGLFHLSELLFRQVTIAYEPVWAIGTGENATPDQAQEIHAHIRGLVRNKYGGERSRSVPILYGGSVKPGNARDLFSQPDVDGGLVGGASLKTTDFIQIINSF